MIQHPLTLFIFSLANIVSGLAWATGAIAIIRRGVLSARTRGLGATAFTSNAIAHFGLAYLVLFRDQTTAGQASSFLPVLFIHVLTACAAWGFIAALYAGIGNAKISIDREKDFREP